MFMKLIYSIIILCCSSLIYAQPLIDGMAILTNKTGVNYDLTDGISHSFQIFDTGNNLTAPFGENWETTFFTPSDPDVYAQWQLSNMGDLFGIAIDSEKNVYYHNSYCWG